MVETGLAELVDEYEGNKDPLDCCLQGKLLLNSYVSYSMPGGNLNQENVSRVLHLSVNDLENTADQLDKEG